MKKTMYRAAILFLIVLVLPTASATQLLIPVGQVVALELKNDCVTVAALDDESGTELQVGDRLLSIDGHPITSAADVSQALTGCDGTVVVDILRKQQRLRLELAPKQTARGPMLGVCLRQGVTGIGTVTYFDPDKGRFGCLGHGVSTQDGKIVPMSQGFAYAARVMSVRQGKIGMPGQLVGSLESAQPVAELLKNTAVGVFGQGGCFRGEPIPTAEMDQIRTGKATILSTISGDTPREYSVEILKIYPDSQKTDRNLLIRVTDPRLLQTTGGIVQGMSGSPIIQDGKLIGAVTHVLVNDPTMGYGIFIENMLDAAA